MLIETQNWMSSRQRRNTHDDLTRKNIDKFNEDERTAADQEAELDRGCKQAMVDQLHDRIDDLSEANKPQSATLLSNRYHGLAENQRDHNQEQLDVLKRILRQRNAWMTFTRSPRCWQRRINAPASFARDAHVVRP